MAAHKGTTERSRKYMEELMNYTSEQAEYLGPQAQTCTFGGPAVSSYKDTKIAWQYYHEYTLAITPLRYSQRCVHNGSFRRFPYLTL